MGATIDVRIYLQEHFPSTPVAEIATAVEQRFYALGTRTHLLCRDSAMSLIWSGIPTVKGPTNEIVQHSLKIAPVAQFVGEFLDSSRRPSQRADPLLLWLPVWKYQVGLWLPYGETRGRFIHTNVAAASHEQRGVAYEAHYTKGWNKKLLPKLQCIIADWHEEAASVGFAGERLQSSPLLFREGEKGLAFHMDAYEPVTFPWIELYLRLRADLERREWPTELIYRYEPTERQSP